jgi:hypothetical protein
MRRSVLTQKDKEFIIENRLKMPSRELAECIGCSRGPILKFLKDNGLQVSKRKANIFRKNTLTGRTTCTQEEEDFIVANYKSMPIKRIAKEIGRSSLLVNNRLRQLGLKVPKETRIKNIEASRFKKGQTSYNKGKKQTDYMTPEQIARTKKTRFQNGHTPHNAYDKDGVISWRVDARGIEYAHIRISMGNWQAYHVYLWEQANGAVPKGHVIIFKDGNTKNCRLENLEKISMKENMLRNSIYNYPQELQTAIKLTNKIRKEL